MPIEIGDLRLAGFDGSVDLVAEVDTVHNEAMTQLDTLIRAVQAALPQPGDLKVAAKSTPDAGYLRTDGTFKRQADYPGLFAAIGHVHNGGIDPRDGTFKLPLYDGLTLVGAGRAFGTGTERRLGTTFGTETHRLTVGEIPAHFHQQVASFGGSGPTNGLTLNTGSAALFGASSDTSPAGGGTAHDNVQPSAAVNIWIKT